MFFLITVAGFFYALTQTLDKKIVNLKIDDKTYAYEMCFYIIPYALIMCFIEYLYGSLKLEINIFFIIFLLMAVFFRYEKESKVVTCLKHLSPEEDATYLSLSIVIAYIVDTFLGIQEISIWSILSIFLTLLGILGLVIDKINIKKLRRGLLIRIISSVVLGYLTYYILKYCSIALYILIINLLIICIYRSPQRKLKINNIYKKKIIIKQLFGFISLYLNNYLICHSVTVYCYVKPISMILLILLSKINKQTESVKIEDLLLIFFVIIGIYMIEK